MSKVIEGVIKLSNGKIISIAPLDGRRLMINTSSIAFLEKKKNKDSEVVSISLEGKFEINVGDSVKLKTGEVLSVYEVKHILISHHEDTVILMSCNRTKTTTFLVPLLGRTKKQLRFDSYFVNGFLSEDKQYLHLLYRFTGTSVYKSFEQFMITDPLCVTHIECDPYHVVYVFRIPKEYKDDIEYFIEGKYSKFSKGLRQRITKFYGTETSNLMKIISKDKTLKLQMEKDLGISLPKDAELASRPNLKYEIQDYEYE